jgi:putative ABC transport system permease protein
VENPNNPFPSVGEALEAQGASDVALEIRAEGAILTAGFDSATEVNQGGGEDFDDYPVRGLTDSFIENGDVPLGRIANGYENSDEVWEALRTRDDVAIIDGFTVEGGFGPAEFQLEGVPTGNGSYDAPTITIRDAASGESREVDVIGIISFGASSNFFGIFVGEQPFGQLFGEPEMSAHFVALNDPDAANDVAKNIESALVTSGAQADSLKKLADENNALSRSFLYLMQAFMGLGLLVGIAAVGVIAFRTVVERRQQIGMLRAIGYKRNQVALSFLLESSFVTILGVASGILLGLWLAYFLVTSDSFPAEGQAYHIPWLEITVIGIFTCVASLLMTWIPSRQAASVPTAEALRYE